MIITQTPLRVSLLGGGSDFPDFYAREPGCVLSATIDKYVNVIVKRRYDNLIRVGYTRQEIEPEVSLVRHDLVREAMRLTGVERGVEIVTMADIPSRGSGLGSSSTVTVGLLHALHVYQGWLPTRAELAAGACRIELDILGRPSGKQDQYAAAYGGLRHIRFEGREVRVEHAVSDRAVARRLAERLMLFDTGVARQSADVLAEQKAHIADRRDSLRRLAGLAMSGLAALRDGRLDDVGGLMHEGWLLKQGLASKVTNRAIGGMYSAAREAGAMGGKISGAGGGGFLLLFCPPQRQSDVRQALRAWRELEFGLDFEGSIVLLNSRRS